MKDISIQKQIFVRMQHSVPVSNDDLQYIADVITSNPFCCLSISQNLWERFILAFIKGKASPEPDLRNFFDPRSSDIYPQPDQIVGVLFGCNVFVKSDNKTIEIFERIWKKIQFVNMSAM